MRRLLALALWLITVPAAAQFPSPTFQNLTILGTDTISGALTVAGASSLSGGGTLGGTFAGPTTLANVAPTITTSTLAGLPANPTPGTVRFVQDCLNGSQGLGFGTGCLAYADDNGHWQQMSTPSALPMTIGGQTLFLGGVTTNQGTGNRLQLATSSSPGVNGQCAQFDANLNIVPSGAGCGGGGGSGTVSAGATNQIGFYAGAGTTISGLATANNGILVTSGAGVPSISSTGPANLTFSTANLPSPVITGTASVTAATFSGKLATAASIVGGANLNIPQGTAPTTPGNGDVWATSAGLFGRFNGATIGPFVGLAQFSATSPITYNSGTGVFACATCLTAAGGALVGTAPIVVTGNAVSLSTTIAPIQIAWPANLTVTADSFPVPDTWPWATGTIDSVVYHTGGTSTPSFIISLQINGVPVTGCTNVTVSSGTDTTTSCTAANAITTGQHLTLTTSSITGTPFSAAVQINTHHSNP